MSTKYSRICQCWNRRNVHHPAHIPYEMPSSRRQGNQQICTYPLSLFKHSLSVKTPTPLYKPPIWPSANRIIPSATKADEPRPKTLPNSTETRQMSDCVEIPFIAGTWRLFIQEISYTQFTRSLLLQQFMSSQRCHSRCSHLLSLLSACLCWLHFISSTPPKKKKKRPTSSVHFAATTDRYKFNINCHCPQRLYCRGARDNQATNEQPTGRRRKRRTHGD